MAPDDLRALVSKDMSVESLQNYFANKPVPTRRELAELKRYVAHKRFHQPPGLVNDLLDLDTIIPTRSKWVSLYT